MNLRFLKRVITSNVITRRFRFLALSGLTALLAGTTLFLLWYWQDLVDQIDLWGRRLGADAIVVPQGSEEEFSNILVRGEMGRFFIGEDPVEELKQIPGVRNASSQLFIASLYDLCCSMPIQIIGFDPSSDFSIMPWIAGGAGSLAPGEILLGSDIERGVDELVVLFGEPYRVAGRLEPTGLGLDTSVMMSLPDAREAARRFMAMGGQIDLQGSSPISTVLLQLDPQVSIQDLTNDVSRRFGGGQFRVIGTAQLFRSATERLEELSTIALSLVFLLWLLALVVLGFVFMMIANERRREFGIMLMLGGTRSWLMKVFLGEAFIMSALGTFFGISLVTVLVIFIGVPGSDSFAPGLSGIAVLLMVGLMSLASGPLSVLIPVTRVAASEPAKLITEEA